MSLTELKIKSLKPREKRYMVSDGRGLYIAVMPTGEKYWYAREWCGGRETKRSLGRYPDISLKQARELKHAPREQRVSGVTFGAAAMEWFEQRHKPSVSPSTWSTTLWRLNRHVISTIGRRRLNDITPREILGLIREIQQTAPYEAHRVLNLISSVYSYAIAADICNSNPAAQLTRAVTPPPPANNLSILRTPEHARRVFADIARLDNPLIRLYLLTLAHVFVRPIELREAIWDEIDIDAAVWEIPAERMKKRRRHVVPLSRQVVELLGRARELSRHPVYVYVSPQRDAPISTSLVSLRLRQLGLGLGHFTPHAFRGLASTILNEHGFAPDVIELQLAHADANAVRAIYNRAEHKDERRRMMQWYSDYLDELTKGLSL